MSESPKNIHAPSREAASPTALVMDGAGMVVEWTGVAEGIFGWSRAEATGKKLSALIIPERHRGAHEAGLKRFLGGGQGALLDRTLEIIAIDHAGREFTVEIRITAEKSDFGYPVCNLGAPRGVNSDGS